MARYMEFQTNNGTVLVDVTETGSNSQGTPVSVGSNIKNVVVQVQAHFEDTLTALIRTNATALLSAVNTLPDPPDAAEMTFGLKATGEVGTGALGIAKLTGEANFGVKLTWTRKEA